MSDLGHGRPPPAPRGSEPPADLPPARRSAKTRPAPPSQAAVPLLVGAMQRQAASPTGLDALAGALDRDHDGSILDDIGGFLGSGGTVGRGAGILGHVLGARQDNVAASAGQVHRSRRRQHRCSSWPCSLPSSWAPSGAPRGRPRRAPAGSPTSSAEPPGRWTSRPRTSCRRWGGCSTPTATAPRSTTSRRSPAAFFGEAVAARPTDTGPAPAGPARPPGLGRCRLPSHVSESPPGAVAGPPRRDPREPRAHPGRLDRRPPHRARRGPGRRPAAPSSPGSASTASGPRTSSARSPPRGWPGGSRPRTGAFGS